MSGDWRERMRKADRRHGFEWGLDHAAARSLAHDMLGEAAERLGDAKVVELADKERIELRGTHDGSPVRFAIRMDVGAFRSIEMRAPNRLGEIELERDPDRAPAAADDDDDPWAEQGPRCKSLADGIFVEGDPDELAGKLHTWAKLPEAVRARILGDMESLQAHMLHTYAETIHLIVGPMLAELDDPVRYMEACAELLAVVRDAVAEGEIDPSQMPRVRVRGPLALGASRQVTCSFCSASFLLTAAQPACPHCGAPHPG